MKSNRTRVKVCGICRTEDALLAVDAGADAIGLIFYDKSPRSVSIEQAKTIIAHLPSFITTIGLFVNPDQSEVRNVLSELALDRIQFHGEEQSSFCESFNRPFIKALSVRDGEALASLIQQYPSASGILLDTWHEKMAGGTGMVFDWSALESLDREALDLDRRLILAGGLNSANINEAIRIVQPHAVDVSSGVESEPGKKSANKVLRFFNEVNRG